MPTIELFTEINADLFIVFDLSRSIDLHKISTEHTKEEAIAGKRSGLIELDEFVTWKARHFGITQTLTSKITEFRRPDYFVDEMQYGSFRYFKHRHIFSRIDETTLMKDVFEYGSPFGIIGKFVDFLFLKKYMRNLLEKRNAVIKNFAETGRWREIEGIFIH